MPTVKCPSNLRFLPTAVISIIIVSLIFDVYILYVHIKPEPPSVHLTSVAVHSFGTAAEAELTAAFDVAVTLRNPNTNLSVSYDSLEVAVWFGQRAIASAAVEPLWQAAAGETPVRARFEAVRKVFPRGVVNAIAEQRAHGSVGFGVTLRARVRFWWHNALRTVPRALTVECYPLHVVFSPDDGDTGRSVAHFDCNHV